MTRLLFDQNLFPRLPGRFQSEFPDAVHVSQVGLAKASDDEIWRYARAHDCVIVTKDADFGELGLMLGFPPKVVWIRRGNCSTGEIEALLRENVDRIHEVMADADAGTLVLF